MRLQYLLEMIVEPSKEERKEHKKKQPNDGKLYYIVKDDEGKKVLTYVDKKYVDKIRKKTGKKLSPKQVAKRRLSEIEYFKKKKG